MLRKSTGPSILKKSFKAQLLKHHEKSHCNSKIMNKLLESTVLTCQYKQGKNTIFHTVHISPPKGQSTNSCNCYPVNSLVIKMIEPKHWRGPGTWGQLTHCVNHILPMQQCTVSIKNPENKSNWGTYFISRNSSHDWKYPSVTVLKTWMINAQ